MPLGTQGDLRELNSLPQVTQRLREEQGLLQALGCCTPGSQGVPHKPFHTSLNCVLNHSLLVPAWLLGPQGDRRRDKVPVRTDRVSITTECLFPKVSSKGVPSLTLPSSHPARSFSARSPGMAGRAMPRATRRLGNVARRPKGSHAGRPRPWPHTAFSGRSTGQPHGGGLCRPVPA